MKLFLNRHSRTRSAVWLEVLFGLAAEADDEVAGDGRVRKHLADAGEHLAVELDGVAALHPLAASRSSRSGPARAGRARPSADRASPASRASVMCLGMIRDEPQPAEAVDVVQHVEQVGQLDRLAAGRVAVAVDRLAEQRHFEAAVVGQLADLVDDFGGRPALLGAAHAAARRSRCRTCRSRT